MLKAIALIVSVGCLVISVMSMIKVMRGGSRRRDDM
jgi:hypothetical protein